MQEEYYEEETSGLCYYVWVMTMVIFITVVVPFGIFLLPFSLSKGRTRHPTLEVRP